MTVPLTIGELIFNETILPPLFFHSDTSPALGNGLVYSADKTHILAVAVELIWLLFLNILSFNFFKHRTNLLGLEDLAEAM